MKVRTNKENYQSVPDRCCLCVLLECKLGKVPASVRKCLSKHFRAADLQQKSDSDQSGSVFLCTAIVKNLQAHTIRGEH